MSFQLPDITTAEVPYTEVVEATKAEAVTTGGQEQRKDQEQDQDRQEPPYLQYRQQPWRQNPYQEQDQERQTRQRRRKRRWSWRRKQ